METYTPYIPPESISDPVRLHADDQVCRRWAKALPEDFDVLGVGQSAAGGFADNLSSLPLSVYVPVLGAVGAAGKSAAESAGLLSKDQVTAFVTCLHDESQRDHAFVILDPLLWRQ